MPQRKSKSSLFVAGGVIGVLAIAITVYLMFFSSQKSIDSLAVLPFVNASGDPNTDYLSDGITESLINGLSQLSNLTVMSRSSVFRYKGNEADPQKAGKELGVKAVLMGRVTQRGENLVISAELVNVDNNSHIWGDQYNRKLSDIISIQEEISKEISRNLSVKLGGDEEKKLAKRPTENTEAYQLYLKGRFHWNKRKADDLLKAVEYFQQAIAIDPNYALAYAGLASTYVILPEYSGLPAIEIMPKAEAAATRASELDPTLAESYAAMGLLKVNQWDWARAEKEFKRAIELNPNYPTTYHWYSNCLRSQEKYEEAFTMITRAQELDPLSLIINLNVGEVLGLLHRYDDAINLYKKMIDLDPNFPGTHESLGAVYVLQNRLDEALIEFQEVRRIVGEQNSTSLDDLGYLYAIRGNKEEARNILNQLNEFLKQGNTLSVQIATVYVGLGDYDKAFEWLEKGFAEQNSDLSYLNTSYVWDRVRSDPRFTAILKKIGLGK